ncbi:MAG: xanthine dehydrogenase small subunit [Pseudomonadota bacterium]|nr:xanthine dehydrogenase small subunit [Pseudomonadota bacterium]
MSRNKLVFLRNGERVELAEVGANETLLDYLRLRERACGTKEGCNEGDCGACTIALGVPQDGRLVYEPVNACIRLLGTVDGCDVVTVDDLASGGELHPVQKAMVEHHGSQCGFCTPGIVMALFTLYHAGIRPDRQDVNDWLAGNLCRCTGYRPIADAALEAIGGKAKDMLSARRARTVTSLAQMQDGEDIFIGTKQRFFAAPASISSLAALCAEHPDATIVSGATDVGLWITKQMRDLPKIIHTGRAVGFDAIAVSSDRVRIGAGATYTQAFDALGAIDSDIAEVLRRIGSRQVRASGTVGGNIANGSPIGDTPPMLIALDAELELMKGGAVRNLPLESFFVAYGEQDRDPGELVSAVTVPKLKKNEHFRAWKISKRFDQDISAVLGAFRLTVDDGVVTAARIAFGGMAATPKRAGRAEQALTGVALADEAGWSTAIEAMASDYTPMTDMRASADYRLKVARNLLFKALHEIATGSDGGSRIVGLREAAQ